MKTTVARQRSKLVRERNILSPLQRSLCQSYQVITYTPCGEGVPWAQNKGWLASGRACKFIFDRDRVLRVTVDLVDEPAAPQVGHELEHHHRQVQHERALHHCATGRACGTKYWNQNTGKLNANLWVL